MAQMVLDSKIIQILKNALGTDKLLFIQLELQEAEKKLDNLFRSDALARFRTRR
jgi:hypothetical protein